MVDKPAYMLVTPSKVSWDLERTSDLVLGTVNAPCSKSTDAAELSGYLTACDTSLVQVLELFMNVEPELVLEFAKQHAVPPPALFESYRKICEEGWKPKARMASAMESLEERGGYDESPRQSVEDV